MKAAEDRAAQDEARAGCVGTTRPRTRFGAGPTTVGTTSLSYGPAPTVAAGCYDSNPVPRWRAGLEINP